MSDNLVNLKNNKFLRRVFDFVFTEHLNKYLIHLFPVTMSKFYYYFVLGKKLNLNPPVDFNEKLQYIKLYYKNDLIYKCADKYDVRSYVEELGCPEILNELYGVYYNVDDIDFSVFPERFVIKTSNSCGTNIICRDKDSFDVEDCKKRLKRWMKIDYSVYSAEIHYSKIKPKIICEKFIENSDGLFPDDYKFYCFNGKVKMILIVTGRGKKVQFKYFDENWNILHLSDEENEDFVPVKPACLSQMIEYSEKLASPFPFVRVDMYELDNKPILGEMTFTPAGCMDTDYNEFGLKYLGDLVDISGIDCTK